MGYPAPANFDSAQDYAGWWQFARADGVPTVCATTGATLVSRARTALGLGPGVWDDGFQSQLIARARAYQSQDPSWRPVVGALQADAQAKRVSKTSLVLAIWLAWYQPVGLRLDAISVPDNFVAPSWGRALSASGASLICWDPTSQPGPEILNSSERAVAEQQSTQGIRSTTSINPVTPPPGPSGAPNAAVWVAVGALLLVTAIAFHQTRKGRPA